MTLDISYTIDCPSYDTIFNQCREVVESISEDPFLETEISLVVVSPLEIQRLNQQYRDKDAVTDVLSFHHWDTLSDIFPGFLLGEIFICYQRAEEQAQSLGHSITEELALLCNHGLLHLQGYDHITDADNALMSSKENQILNILKAQNLF